MHGTDCDCCRDYYRITANVPLIQEAGAMKKSRQQAVSKHRVWSKRPDTPPGFWDVDFPSDEVLSERKRLWEFIYNK